MKKFYTNIKNKYFKHSNSEDIFDKIYSKGKWGKGISGKSTSGLGSHDPQITSTYIEAIKDFLGSQKEKLIIVDLGCGDFNVGKNFVDYASKLIACDISNIIIKRNQKSYNYPNTHFNQLNIAKDPLPAGNIAFIRQVLQHISNEEILSIVRKLNRNKPYQYLIVTEHLPLDANFKINIDKPTGSGTRLSKNGGVDLSYEPFNLIYSEKRALCEVTSPNIRGIIRTTLYTI